ncbi:MAG: ABC transporter permease [Phototrophicaceae bacterium]
MNRLWLVFQYELKRNISRKGYLFATFGLPLVAILIYVGFPIYQSFQLPEEEATNPLAELSLDRLERAGYVDHSGVFTEPSARFEDVLFPYDSEADALNALEAEEIDVYLVFPEDYLETGDVSVHVANVNIMLVGDGESLSEQLAYSTFASGLDEIRLRRLNNPTIYTDFDLSLNAESSGAGAGTDDGEFWFVYVFAMVFFISLILTNTYLMQTVIEERDNRMIEILISTVKPSELLGGKILAMALMGMLQILCWGLVASILFALAPNFETYADLMAYMDIQIDVNLLFLMVVYFVLMYLVYAAVFGTIGAISGSAQEGSQYSGFIVLPAMIPFYFFPLIQSDPNGLFATVLSIIPITSPITIMARMVIGDVPSWQIGLSIVLLALLAAGAMWMAGRIFRVQTLLSGTKLKFADIPRLVFAS